jgi:hypothetical protein
MHHNPRKLERTHRLPSHQQQTDGLNVYPATCFRSEIPCTPRILVFSVEQLECDR